jgi:stearoyl-CoA 9-desaturase NADPH oxidoreductase
MEDTNMETTAQTNLFDTFRYFERLLPDYARTGLFNPAAQSYVRGSAARPMATVLERRHETGDTVSFLLKTPENYPPFQPGQHIDVAVEINGVRTVRQYSLTGSVTDKTLSITVKRAAEGKVSNHLHDHIHAGMQVEISVPRGDFAMPATDHSTYLFFSAGSGITPIYAMVRALLEQGAWGDIHFFHAAKNANSVIFREELTRLAAEYENFHPYFFYSDDGEKNRLSAASAVVQLQNAVHPPHTPVRICGAGDFVQGLEKDLKELQYSQIQSEYYTLPKAGAVGEGTARFLRSRSAVKVETNLLEAAEAAGLKPKHGCRRGICHECKAHKRSGIVKNLLNGKETSGREDIQLCITQPVGEVEIDL